MRVHRMFSLITFALVTLGSGMMRLEALAAPTSGTTETTRETLGERTYLGEEKLGIKPQLGVVGYTDSRGEGAARFAYGLTGEYNLADAMGIDYERWFIGPQTGVTFSHMGNPSSNAFGADTDSTQRAGEAGANLAIIPMNLKAGYAPMNWLRLSVHGGGNAVYRSLVSSISMGDDDSKWRILPNLGADIEFGLSRDVSLTVRPDWTASSGNPLFSGALALGIALN